MGALKTKPPTIKRPRCRRGLCQSRAQDNLDACGSGELPLLEALPAEDRTALRRAEGDGGLLAASRTVGRGFDPLACRTGGARGTRRALRFAALTALGFVLEVLVGKEQLFSGRPEELGAAVHAVESFVLELHRPTSHELARLPAHLTGPVKKGTRPF